MRKFFPLATIFITGILVLTYCGKSPDVVAKVGREKISLQEFKAALSQDYRTNDLESLSMEKKNKTLQKLIDERLEVIKAKNMGLQDDPAFQKEMKVREDRLIATDFFNTEIIDNLVPESMVHAFYTLQQHQIKALAIVLGYQGATTYQDARSLTDAKSLAAQIISSLKSGEQPEKLAELYSTDQMSKRNKGVLDPYLPGTYDPQVDIAMEHAKANDIVGPVVTDRGVFIIKILKMMKKPDSQNYKDVKEQVRNSIAQKFFRDKATATYRKLSQQYADEMGSEVSESGIKEFIDAANQWIKNANNSDDTFPQDKRSIVLAKVGNFTMDGEYFINLFAGRFFQGFYRYNKPEVLKQVMEDQVRFMAWVFAARKKGIDKSAQVTRQIDALARKRLVSLLNSKLIRDKVQVSPEEINQYYEAHKADFLDPAKIHVWEIAVKDQKLAQNVYRKARAGQDFEKLAKQYSEKANTRARGGNLGFQVKRENMSAIVKKAFDAGAGKILEPEKIGTYFYVIKTGQYMEPRQKTEKEVEQHITTVLRPKKEEALQKDILAELQKKYTYWVNETLVRRLS